MRKIKKWWLRFSLKRKLMILIAFLMMSMVLSEGTIMLFSMSALNEFEVIMDSNSIYNELQEAIREEQEAFIAYIRNRTDENKHVYEDACVNSEACIESLPFTYSELGEERYARTWNIISGYDGYVKYRDQLIDMEETDPEYIDSLYQVLGMQENLSDYALRLVQVTHEQWDETYEEKSQTLTMVPFIIGIVILIVLVFFLFSWRIISESVLLPLLLIAEDSRKIAVSQFDTPPLRVDNRDEIGDLVTAFNKMKIATNKYIRTLKEKNRIAELLHKEEMEKVELETRFDQAQLEVLKHQVNPHFLFNTLNMISSMARLEDAEVTNKMIISLGNLFRYNLRTVEQEVYLEQELEVLDDYIYIQQMRFDHRIQYEKKIEVDEHRVRIPSFTLQPLVENAFVHGVSSIEEGGKIVIHIWEEKNKVYISISDNGCGMDKKTLQRVKEQIHKTNTTGRGIGLGNICRRIDMMYEDGEVKITSDAGNGTTVRLGIPQRYSEEEA